jgi:hypothetical protein
LLVVAVVEQIMQHHLALTLFSLQLRLREVVEVEEMVIQAVVLSAMV